MKKIVCCHKNLSRENLANYVIPLTNSKTGVMNIKDKSIIEDL